MKKQKAKEKAELKELKEKAELKELKKKDELKDKVEREEHAASSGQKDGQQKDKALSVAKPKKQNHFAFCFFTVSDFTITRTYAFRCA